MPCSKRSSSYPSIPFELVEEILTRTQAESLLRFKAVCKQWYFLITDKKFIYNHLNHSPQRLIRMTETNVQIIDPLTGVCSHSPVPSMFQHMHHPWFPRPGCPYPHEKIIHCDGLMLCLCTRLYSLGPSNDFVLVLWSPVLRVMKWIYPSESTYFLPCDYYGMGYDVKSRHNYKVLRFVDYRFDISARTPSVEIFEFDTGYWRTLDVKLDWDDLHVDIRGLSVKGNTYWIVNNPSIILSFDFSDETFKYVCDCPPISDACLLGCFDKDRLSLLVQYRGSRELQVWITNNLGDQDVSFTKYFSVVHSDLPGLKSYGDIADPVHVIGKNKSIMVWCAERVIEEEDDKESYYSCLTLYEIDDSGVRKQIETDQRRGGGGYVSYTNTTYNCGFLFVPSLVPLPGLKFSIEPC